MYSETGFVFTLQFFKNIHKAVCHFHHLQLQEMFALVVMVGIGIDGVAFGLFRFLLDYGQIVCTFLCQGALLVEAIVP